MGHLTSTHNWSQTPLGPPDQWPLSLRTTLSILLNSKFPMFLFWGSESLCFYNDAYRPSLGNDGKHPNALGKPGAEVWPEIWPVIKPLIDQIMTGGEATWSEDQLIPIFRNGAVEDVYWTFSYSPVSDESGEPAGVFVTCTETTEKIIRAKQQQEQKEVQYIVQQRLKESEERFRTMAEDSDILIAMSDETGQTTYLNKQWTELTGQPVTDLYQLGCVDWIHPDDRDAFLSLYGSALSRQESFGGELRILNKHKEYRWLLVRCPARYRHDGTFAGYISSAIDITERKKAEVSLRASEAKLRSLIAAAPVAIGVFVGRDLVVDLPNQLFIDIVGKGSNIAGKPLREVMPELITENQPFLQILDDVYTTGQMFQSYGSRVDIMRQGVMTHNYYNITYSPLFNEAGDVYAILDIAVDVTGQILAQQQVAESEAALRGAIELAQLGTWSIDVATNRLTYSDRLTEWVGYDPGVQHYSEVIPALEENDQKQVETAMAWALNPASDGVYNAINIIINPKTGQKRILHAQGKTVFDTTGKAIRMNGTTQDITIQRELQLALENEVQQRTRQLQTTIQDLERSNDNLQQFAYVASHDLQEPLRKIQSFGDMLHNQYGTQLGEMGNDFLDRMQTSATRMSTLIKDLLTYSRISTRQDISTEVSLQTIMNTVLADLDLAIQESGATLHIDPLPTVQGDQSQLGQLFQNLLNNAIKFRKVDQISRIRITCQTVATTNLPPLIKPTRTVTAYYRIDVSDNGIGFDEQYADRIFQVFQRLHGKAQYAGTGIGLAICEKVVANHGGAITASSKLGEGATFSVYLPKISM